MHVSAHMVASLETLGFSELFCNHFDRSNDPCIFTSWLRASLHVGCGHLRLMIVATILTASWLHASFWGWWLLEFWLLIWYCNFNQRVKCISKWRLGMSSTLSIIIKRSLILPSLFALGMRYCERLSAVNGVLIIQECRHTATSLHFKWITVVCINMILAQCQL